MDRRRSPHANERKLKRYNDLINREKELQKEIARKEELKKQQNSEYNTLWLAQTVVESLEKQLTEISQCKGCPQCANTDKKCFTVIVNK